MLGIGVPKELSNLSSVIARVRTHLLDKLFISLASY
jgi:hypothetical protein